MVIVAQKSDRWAEYKIWELKSKLVVVNGAQAENAPRKKYKLVMRRRWGGYRSAGTRYGKSLPELQGVAEAFVRKESAVKALEFAKDIIFIRPKRRKRTDGRPVGLK